MEARRIDGAVYRIKTTHGGFLVEVPRKRTAIVDYDEMEKELARFCAELSVSGYIISSVTRVYNADTATPRVSVLTSKEYKSEIKRLMEERKFETKQ